MKRFSALSMVVVVLLSTTAFAADGPEPGADDPIAKTLAAAKQAFQSKVEEARKKLLPAFDVELNRINTRKLPAEQRIRLIEECQAARKAFEEDGTSLPSLPGMKAAASDYRTTVLAARKKCEAAFEAAAASYLAKKPADLDTAKAVIAEKTEFFKDQLASDKPGVGTALNLIPHLKLERDSFKGTWTIDKEGVSSKGGRLLLPYQPGTEYDFHIEFTRSEGDGDVVQMVSQGDRRFAWIMGYKNAGFGFSRIAEKNADSNVSWVAKSPALDNGKRYDCVVQVRRKGVRAVVNGKEIASYETDFADMSEQSYWAINAPLGIGCKSATTFHVIEITPITGSGTLTTADKLPERDAETTAAGGKTGVRKIPEDAVKWEKHFYKSFPAGLTWPEAKRKCEEMGGYLVCIETEAEQKFIVDLVVKDKVASRYWIGATDEKDEGKWLWVNGEPVKYARWGAGEPNDKGGEDYADLFLHRPSQDYAWWSDVGPDKKDRGFICEWPGE